MAKPHVTTAHTASRIRHAQRRLSSKQPAAAPSAERSAGLTYAPGDRVLDVATNEVVEVVSGRIHTTHDPSPDTTLD